MKNFFLITFWIFAICLIAVADYEEQPYYALFGTLMVASFFGYAYSHKVVEFFNDNNN